LNDNAVKAAERRVRDVVSAAGEQREQAERELFDASQTVEALEAQLDQAVGGEAAVAAKLVELRESLVVAEQSAKAVQALHLQEIGQLRDVLAEERRSGIAVGLERDQCRDALSALKSKFDTLEWSHQEYIKTAEKGARKNEELAAQAKADRGLAHKESAEAREALAQLRGQLDATLLHNETLLRKLTAHKAPVTVSKRAIKGKTARAVEKPASL
jgi:colicin import membrane protein